VCASAFEKIDHPSLKKDTPVRRTQKKKAIYIVAGAFTNKGPEAMLLTVADAIRNRLPDVNIFARIPSRYFQEARHNGLIPVNGDPPRSAIAGLISKVRTARIYHKSTYLDIGGYQFGDPWGEKHAWNKLRGVKHCVRFGNQVFFMPQTWGPFSSDSIRQAVRNIIHAATLVFARDKTSFAELQKLAGTDNPKVRFAHDLAWNFQGAALSVGRQLIQDAGLSIKKDQITVCVTPNLRVYERSKGNGQDSTYIETLRDIIRHLCSRHSTQVILIGHELRTNNSEVPDDRILCNYVLKSLGKSLPVVHIDKFIPAAQVKSVIGNCDLAISSRYHALIAALSQGVPAIAIGWAHKYDELLAEFGLSSNLLSLSRPTEEILKDIDAVIERLPQIRQTIPPTVEAMKRSGQEAIGAVISKIEERFRD
jgi:colanic acid/amylovoran biosynthesis protein